HQLCLYFFFQAEDGIRDRNVTGVQTCALPILATGEIEVRAQSVRILSEALTPPFPIEEDSKTKEELRLKYRYLDLRRPDLQKKRSEERRVGKEERKRWVLER